MRTAGILAAALAAGCFRPAPPEGAPCAPPGAAARCPDGQACVVEGGVERCWSQGGPGPADAGAPADARADAPTDARADGSADAAPDAPPADRDLDGVVDPQDDCPDAPNPDQADEDGDGLGDPCDPCPPFADGATPADADHDGVGDSCDPHPATPGDAIARFEGFHGPLSAAWITNGTTWTVAGDDVAAASSSASPASLVIPTPMAIGSTYTVLAGVTTTALNGAPSSIGVVDYGTPAGGMMCGLVRDPASPPSEAVALYLLGAGTYKQRTALPLNLTAPFAVALARSSTAYACAGVNLATGASGSAVGSDAIATGKPALRLVNAAARYHWVLVVDSP